MAPRRNYKAFPGRVAWAKGVAARAPSLFNRERILNMKISTFVSTLALGMFVASSAFALDAADPAAAPKPDAAAKAAKSAECSKEADAKGLHGKERKKFRSECKKGTETK
jgi:hypothetical protein